MTSFAGTPRPGLSRPGLSRRAVLAASAALAPARVGMGPARDILDHLRVDQAIYG